MTRKPAAAAGASPTLRARVLDRIADGAVLVGTVRVLARGLGVSVRDLRSCLRELLEARTIAVSAEEHGQVTIRRERRTSQTPPPSTERRRPDRRRQSLDAGAF